jgi:hypothetical protein
VAVVGAEPPKRAASSQPLAATYPELRFLLPPGLVQYSAACQTAAEGEGAASAAGAAASQAAVHAHSVTRLRDEVRSCKFACLACASARVLAQFSSFDGAC